MERITRSYVGRVNLTNGERGYINIAGFNGMPTVQQSMDDAKGFNERTDVRTLMQGLNLVNQSVKGNFEYYEIIRDETTRTNTNGLSEEALKWLNGEPEEEEEEEVPEEQPAE